MSKVCIAIIVLKHLTILYGSLLLLSKINHYLLKDFPLLEKYILYCYSGTAYRRRFLKRLLILAQIMMNSLKNHLSGCSILILS